MISNTKYQLDRRKSIKRVGDHPVTYDIRRLLNDRADKHRMYPECNTEYLNEDVAQQIFDIAQSHQLAGLVEILETKGILSRKNKILSYNLHFCISCRRFTYFIVRPRGHHEVGQLE